MLSLQGRWTLGMSKGSSIALMIWLLAPFTHAGRPQALSVTPSSTWIGDDGMWSTISLRIGSPQQWVNLIPSTTISETWVVSSHGCISGDTLCESSRGGLFVNSNSKTWSSKGFYGLGITTQPASSAYGDYGLDKIGFGTTSVTLSKTIIAAINDTMYWVPFFGLGIVPGDFDGETTKSSLSALVEDAGAIPSHAYGFTAGASYQQKSTPLSLTLGGYDRSRFSPHSVSFSLNPTLEPELYISSISFVSATSLVNATSASTLLKEADAVTAIIDSSTPFLWLPQTVCDRFAKALGLEYDSSLDLYTFGENDTQLAFLRNAKVNFTFSLADMASSTDIVNIVLPFDAFNLLASYPFLPNTTYGAANSSMNYFPLKVSQDANKYIIGRSFLQEAYIITDYERNNFSVYQAVHTTHALSDTDIIDIPRYDQTQLTGPPVHHRELSTSEIAAIAVGAVSMCAVIGALVIYCLRRHRRRRDLVKEDDQPLQRKDCPVLGSFRSRSDGSSSLSFDEKNTLGDVKEVGADATHERFELPAPLGPTELESSAGKVGTESDKDSINDPTDGSRYEIAQRQLVRSKVSVPYRGLQEMFSDEMHQTNTSIAFDVQYLEGDKKGSIPSSHADALAMNDGRSVPLAADTRHEVELRAKPPPLYHSTIVPTSGLCIGGIPEHIRLPTTSVEHLRDGNYSSDLSFDSSPSIPSEPSTLSSQSDAQSPLDDASSVSALSQTTSGESRHSQPRQQRILDDLSKFRREDLQTLFTTVKTVNTERKAKLPAIEEQKVRESRLVDGSEIVHVPQCSDKRYSWEQAVTEAL